MKKIIFISLIFVFFSKLLNAEINIYFSHSVDTTLANPHKAQGFVALDEKLIERIDQAQYSIDFCFYNIKRQNIVDSLISTFNRGLDVRVITEHDHIDNQVVQDLINAGITVIDDTFGNNSGNRYMHNKFAIFDFRDSSSVVDDWIWTGSYNITDEGTESNANNVIEIQHSDLARAYTLEFEEMWGSDSGVPNPDSSKFHGNKTDNTQHNFLIDSIPVGLYFSPSDGSTEKICNAISTADSTIYFCILAFTRQDVCDTMKTKWDSGISVKGVFDRSDWLGQYSKSRDMTGDTTSNNPWNPPAPVYSDSVQALWGPKRLHHKYMLIDSDFDSGGIVITGSQNWSNNGELYNDENTLIIYSSNIANQYLQEFVERYREAGCIGCSEDMKVVSSNKIKVFPNPFTKSVKIEDCSEVKVYDITGKLVTEVKEQWDGRNTEGKEVKAGIYFLKSKGKSFGKVTKLR
ncbi:MAG: T9SS type A sorting domain-containing protein [Candidatus Marinimicrobia bacterium]|nr:T9SS type A sorting domain-containing protein [candidate division WOR-3 bacterium]MCK4447241.1 T9SS type A sorting domain-containing protein [Candidatus Neomarinimicrobiota bacterium]